MPELPEAEITKRKLMSLGGKIIVGFWSDWPRGLKVARNPASVEKDIRDRKVLNMRRYGKAILLDLSKRYEKVGIDFRTDRLLAFHQGMSGKLLILQNADDMPRHAHFKVLFGDGRKLLFIDPRKFGIVWYGRPDEVMQSSYFASLGPDMLSVSLPEFKNRLRRHGAIKPLLLNQTIIAGVGNIIADESLWRSKIHPMRPATDLTDSELNKLHNSIKKVIAFSIRAKGTSMRDWGHPDGDRGKFQEKFKIYSRDGKICPRCKTSAIRRILAAGRGTWICSKCQII